MGLAVEGDCGGEAETSSCQTRCRLSATQPLQRPMCMPLTSSRRSNISTAASTDSPTAARHTLRRAPVLRLASILRQRSIQSPAQARVRALAGVSQRR